MPPPFGSNGGSSIASRRSGVMLPPVNGLVVQAYDGLLLEGQLEEYEAVFRAIDKSGNGTLAASELAEVLQVRWG
jgi:hypothetical protein